LRLQTFPRRKRRENQYRFYFDDNYSEYKSFYAYSEYEAIEKAIKIIRKKLFKQAILELETAKKKLKQEELIIEYGKEIEANAIVTCNKTIAKMGNILVYNGLDYTIVSLVPSDSHTTLIVNGSDTNG